jgi:hypothetical protein
MRLITKKQRLDLQTALIEGYKTRGFKQEVYKGLNIFTGEENGKFYLTVFRDTISKPTANFYYRTAESREKGIEGVKNSYDNREAYRAKAKANPTHSTAANASAAIKAELKEVFPDIKFSVRSDNFSMGNSVDISWTDGPTSDQVEKITDKYQYGHFNGMEDIYEYTNSREDIPQAKYVSAHRKISEELTALLLPIFTDLLAQTSRIDDGDYRNSPENILYRILNKTSFPTKWKATGIERTDLMSGSFEDFYRVTFNGSDAPKIEPTFEKVEVKAGEVQIIDYSQKAIAVIGDTKPIKDKLKALGGKFNFRLSVGPGWIFPKTKLDEIQKALSAPEETTLKDEIKKTVEFFKESDIQIYGEAQESTKEIEIIQATSTVKEFDNLKDITEAANMGEMISLLNLSNIVNNKPGSRT